MKSWFAALLFTACLGGLPAAWGGGVEDFDYRSQSPGWATVGYAYSSDYPTHRHRHHHRRHSYRGHQRDGECRWVKGPVWIDGERRYVNGMVCDRPNRNF